MRLIVFVIAASFLCSYVAAEAPNPTYDKVPDDFDSSNIIGKTEVGILYYDAGQALHLDLKQLPKEVAEKYHIETQKMQPIKDPLLLVGSLNQWKETLAAKAKHLKEQSIEKSKLVDTKRSNKRRRVSGYKSKITSAELDRVYNDKDFYNKTITVSGTISRIVQLGDSKKYEIQMDGIISKTITSYAQVTHRDFNFNPKQVDHYKVGYKAHLMGRVVGINSKGFIKLE
ncbi:MAG: hypothetical protein AAGA18_07880 [Verrucomicrobiota bacterium]